MRTLFVLFMILISPILVSAQNTNEGRIAEHEIVSFVAFIGLVTVVYFVRKKRKFNPTE